MWKYKRLVALVALVSWILYVSTFRDSIAVNSGMLTLSRALITESKELAVQSESILQSVPDSSPVSRSAQRGEGFALAVQGREEEAIDVWSKTDGMAEEFILRGDINWKLSNYKQAALWYGRAEKMIADNSSLSFRLAVTSVLSGLVLPQSLDSATLVTYPLTESVKIKGEALQWMRDDPRWSLDYGDQLVDHPSSNYSGVGVMWWSGVALTVIDVYDQAEYQVIVRARHSNSIPSRLQVEHNFVPIGDFQINEHWQELTVEVFLSSGKQVIGIRYPDDEGDAILDWIEIKKIG
jgi:hypothetical protein